MICAVVLATVPGCDAGGPPAARPPSPAPSVQAAANPPAPSAQAAVNSLPPRALAAADEPPGALACGRIAEAVRGGTLMQPGVVTGISTATATADAPVADAATRLQQAYEQAVKAQGTEDEPDLVAAVSAAGAEMVSVCADSGLETAG
ncbi:hypothetical protein Asp14428_32370 [Actinoplanes sp. NBRC 14428]|nr:hypothetical protein Asp14428_32370 [Actinoplanes sp. NBRC 14428]